jgi:Ca2+-binding RTX toxin-like protein
MRKLYKLLDAALRRLRQSGQAPRLRRAQHGRRVRFESLEPRLALAGDVSATELQNQPPLAVDDAAFAYSSSPGSTASYGINLLANDSTGSDTGERLSIISLGAPTGGGTVVLESLGGSNVMYRPAPYFSGTDSFTYTISDGRGGTDTATVAVTVFVAPPEIPTVDFFLELTNPDGSPLTSLSPGQDFVLHVKTQDTSDPAHGVFAAYLDVSWDSRIAIATGPINYASTYAQGHFQSASVGAGLIDEVGGFAGISELGDGVFEVFSVPMRATSAGSLVFTADPADVAPITDVLVYSRNGSVPDENIRYGTAAIEVGGTYLSGNDAFTVLEDSNNTTLAPLANDVALGSNASGLTIVSVGSPNRGGSVVINSDGKTLVYTSAANFSGTETFTYTAQNANGEKRTATVTMTVQEVNDPPTAMDDVFEVPANSSNQILDLLANDSTAPDSGETLRIVYFGDHSGPVFADGMTFRYTPAPNFVGTETITYTIFDRDSGFLTSQATVTIHVIGLAARPDTITVPDRTVPTILDVLANDSPGSHSQDDLRIVSVTSPSADVDVAVSDDGKRLIFSAANAVNRAVTLSYAMTDSFGGLTSALVTLNFASAAVSTPGITLEDNILHITGTPDRDKFTVNIGHHKLRVSGTLGGTRIDQTFNTRNVQQIIAALGDGNDALTIRGNTRIAIQVDAGAGNDTISSASGTAILLGGDGNDILAGGSRRDVLIGGDGRDQLRGNGGDDLLLGDTTAFDQNPLALTALQSEWNSAQARSTRIANLRAGTGAFVQPRSVALKPDETVFDDGDVDTLFGGGNLDWLFADASNGSSQLPARGRSASRWHPLASG